MKFSKFVFIILLYTLAESESFLWPCETESDCGSVEDAFCSSQNLCQCPPGRIFAGDVSSCLTESLYGQSCTDNNQCSHMLTGSRCNGVCECADGYTYIRGRCKQLVSLQSPCKDDSDCYFGYDRESVTCTDGKCECSDGFYNRTENICRRKSMNVGDLCVVHEDCQGDNLECTRLICTEKVLANNNKNNNNNNNNNINNNNNEHDGDNGNDNDDDNNNIEPNEAIVLAKKLALRDIGIQTSVQKIEKKSVSTSIDVGITTGAAPKQINHPTVLLANEKKKTKALTRQFGETCDTNNSPCTEIAHSICIQGHCLCQRGYFHVDGICKAEIGEVALTRDLCTNGMEVYDEITKRCLCGQNRFNLNNMRECEKPIESMTASCTQHSQCTPFGAAHCPITNTFPRTCLCQSYAEYNAIQQLCIPREKLGSYCDPSAQLTATAVQFIQTPVASTNPTASIIKPTVRIAPKSADEICEIREPNSVCSPNNLCVCKENYVEVNGECKPSADAPCIANSDCALENGECVTTTDLDDDSKYCKCKNGFQYAKKTCLKEATEYNEDCIETEQCTPLLGNLGKCVDSQCKCEDHLQFNNGKCHPKKALGESCTRAAECFVDVEPENVECRNGVCECQFNSKKDTEKLVCRTVPKKNSSDRPSCLKVITLLLTASAVLITSAAIKEAYF